MEQDNILKNSLVVPFAARRKLLLKKERKGSLLEN